MKDTNFLIQNGVDVNNGIEILGDIDTYNQMLEDFLTEVEPKLANLNKYKDQGDMPNYAILAHSLKSDSKYFVISLCCSINTCIDSRYWNC